MGIMDKVRHKIRSFLQIDTQGVSDITLTNLNDFETEAHVNQVWSWGDKIALEQTYKQISQLSDQMCFWASVPAFGIIKRHTGLPAIMVNTLSDIVMGDMDDITTDIRQPEWHDMYDKTSFRDVVSDAVKQTLIVGDGAFRLSINTSISQYPIFEFVPGDMIEYNMVKGKITEIIFRSSVVERSKKYVFEETYGYGYINSRLFDGETEVPLGTVSVLSGVQPSVIFDKLFMMAVPLMFFNSPRFSGRGKSIFSGKHDSFDSLDEIWSQWSDALRKARAKEYIPEKLLPRDPSTGTVLKANPYDHAFIVMADDMSEGAVAKIDVEQPSIPSDVYLQAYVTALDLCLQGVISPSTLGIDNKKLDNADAQREKEKTTLYTRNKIVSALQKTLPELIKTMFYTYDTLKGRPLTEVTADVPFGEYANPSFESTVETVAKAKQGGIMSIEAAVDELYGDSKDAAWKSEEVERIKSQMGFSDEEEPAIAEDAAAVNQIGFSEV